MARLPNPGPMPPLEHRDYDLSKGSGIHLDGARNSTVAFQLILKSAVTHSGARVRLVVSDFVSEKGHRIAAVQSVRRFLAYHHWVQPGGYRWGPESQVLAWPNFYPDALVPFTLRCGEARTTLVESVTVSPTGGKHQALWFDIYIPTHQPTGVYTAQLTVQIDRKTMVIPVRLRVWAATLPNQPSIDAVGEIYAAYQQEGAGLDYRTPAWRAMAHCYQQLAHRHRVVFIERFNSPLGPTKTSADNGYWRDYNKAFGPALSGTLFSTQRNYIGPGQDTPVHVWRPPWPQPYNRRLTQPLSDNAVARYQTLANQWRRNVIQQDWAKTWYFAYIFDEVDGALDDGDEGQFAAANRSYFSMAHRQMKRLQGVFDDGNNANPLHLLWTSHSNPARWSGQADVDLAGTIRLWAPNAGAADPRFLRQRKAVGERVWFYHSGHPAVGVHVINASGIEMRTWGVITARYGLDGHFMWAINRGDSEQPYRHPSYKKKDDRFGNGTLVYPGNKLANIGFTSVPGPIPSMRLKMWRRGLQDAELVHLAHELGRGTEVDKLVQAFIPTALGAATSKTWPDNPAQWLEFHRQLLRLASP